MRLLRIEIDGNLSLVERSDSGIPPYAILSHTWGRDEDEVTFKDWNDGISKSKSGYKKIQSCGEQAAKDGLEYFWIDTLCIDKSSSAELSEAINSMYLWYEAADVCYAYLDDVPSKKSFLESRWFTRGWTLQELVAPEKVIFFDDEWNPLGSRVELRTSVSQCTGIPTTLLSGTENLDAFSVAQRMSWAARRQTKRIEDRAYCMLGLFDIQMPLIYGEGSTAFVRLQEEIMKISEDHSLFAWRSTDSRCGCLATSPDSFSDSGNIILRSPSVISNEPITTSSRGIHLDIPLIGDPCGGGQGFAVLNCFERGSEDKAIALRVRDLEMTMERFERVHTYEFKQVEFNTVNESKTLIRRICIGKSRLGRAQRTRAPMGSEKTSLQYINRWNGSTNPTACYAYGTLLEAAKDGPEDAVWWHLTNKETNVNALDDNGFCAISHAAIRGNENIMRMLLGREGIDVNIKDRLSGTPLSYSASGGHEALVRLLLRTGKANISAYGESLQLAAASGHRAVFQHLIGAANIDLNPDVANMHASLLLAAENGHESIVEMLLHTGRVDVNCYDEVSRETSLLKASMKGHAAVVELLIRVDKVELDSKNPHRHTPLACAAAKGHWSIVKMLLQTRRVDVNVYDNRYRTPLSLAAMNGHKAVVRLLIGVANTDLISRIKQPLRLATENGHEPVVEVLLQTGNVDVDVRDCNRQTLLSLAARNGHEAVVRLLIGVNAVDLNSRCSENRTPLAWAAFNGHETVVKALLQTGKAQVHSPRALKPSLLLVAVNSEYQEPLMLAAKKGHTAVVRLLLDTDVLRPHVKNRVGKLALSQAVKNKRTEVIELFKELQDESDSKNPNTRPWFQR
jgi:ankyrin repeat protein